MQDGVLPLPPCPGSVQLAGFAIDLTSDGGISLTELVDEVGQPILVLPTIFHLLWNHELVTELSQHILAMTTPIYPPGTP